MRGKKFSVFDGPFAEAKELVGGYWLLQAKSKDEVVDWMKKVPFRDGEIEIRALYETGRLPQGSVSEQAGNWRDQETKARAESGAPAPAAPRKPGTTRWMLLLKADKRSEAGELPTEAGMNAMAALMDDMGKAGAMLGGEGLKPTSQGAKVRFRRRQAHGHRRAVRRGQGADRRLPGAADRDPGGGRVEWAQRWLQVHVDHVPGMEESRDRDPPGAGAGGLPGEPGREAGRLAGQGGRVAGGTGAKTSGRLIQTRAMPVRPTRTR